MWTVSSFFNRMIQITRYSVNAMGSVTVYTIYLPEGVSKVGTVMTNHFQKDVNVCWTCSEDNSTVNSFSVNIEGQNVLFYCHS